MKLTKRGLVLTLAGILVASTLNLSCVKSEEIPTVRNANMLLSFNSPSYFKHALAKSCKFDIIDLPKDKPYSIGDNGTEVVVDNIKEYSKHQDSPDWDDVGKIETVTMCYNYLVYDKGLPSELVSGILGNIMCEGDFGYRQGYYNGTQNYNQIINALNGSGGVGIVQWTYYTKKSELKRYYADTFNKVSNCSFKVKCAIAELTYLHYIIKNEGILDKFESLAGSKDALVHSACGMFACEYERYAGYKSQWSRSTNSYKCTNINSNGGKRLNYALKIYHHFNDGIVG